MRTYVAVDSLNPNAVNPRYGRPAECCEKYEIAANFTAATDGEALVIFDEAIERGEVGYSTRNTHRVNARLYRAKEWYRNGAEGRQVA
jgi:hypothetical protein